MRILILLLALFATLKFVRLNFIIIITKLNTRIFKPGTRRPLGVPGLSCGNIPVCVYVCMYAPEVM